MTHIVNLSTMHEYSIEETIKAFVKLCKEHCHGCLKSTPGFFENLYNFYWVSSQYFFKYKALIEPYKLGKIPTEDFLENLSAIFPFMSEMDKEQRHQLLEEAWNASIQIGPDKENRFKALVEIAKSEPVYLISNTNELNVKAILTCLSEANPDLNINPDALDISVKKSQEPVKIFPNIFLCLSYRYGAFKAEAVSTMSLLDRVKEKIDDEITVVSQHSGDLEKARALGILNRYSPEEFYGNTSQLEITKKMQ